jgi:hypothetical protein
MQRNILAIMASAVLGWNILLYRRIIWRGGERKREKKRDIAGRVGCG